MVRDAPYGAPHHEENDQCNRNSPLIARSSAGLDQLQCATWTECSGPSSFACQNSRNFCNSGKLREQIVGLPDIGLQQPWLTAPPEPERAGI